MFKLGRKQRIFMPQVPHYSALVNRRRADINPLPDKVDYTAGLPADLGMMLNDSLGDCTCAGLYHARQVLTQWATKTVLTESDDCVKQLYEGACGYDPANPDTDQGGNEQSVLAYCVNTGFPIGDGAQTEKLLAFVEVDPRQQGDVKRVIYESGGVYIGFEVPRFLMQDAQGNSISPPDIWSLDSLADTKDTIGGHAVFIAGYDNLTVTVISWGRLYKMTWDFFNVFTDEAYALISPDWLASTGQTPLGMTEQDWDGQMVAIKGVGKE